MQKAADNVIRFPTHRIVRARLVLVSGSDEMVAIDHVMRSTEFALNALRRQKSSLLLRYHHALGRHLREKMGIPGADR